MISVPFFKNRRLLPLLALPFLAWLLPSAQEKTPPDFSSEKINLALRRTADGLLRQSGDRTSRIPAVEQAGAGVWRVRLEQPFEYEQLPPLLQASLDLHGISQAYEVAVRRCDNNTIDLGYHQLDFLKNNGPPADNPNSEISNPPSADLPCGGREMPEGCHFIEIIFLENKVEKPFWAGKTGILWLILGGLAGFWFFRRQKPDPAEPAVAAENLKRR